MAELHSNFLCDASDDSVATDDILSQLEEKMESSSPNAPASSAKSPAADAFSTRRGACLRHSRVYHTLWRYLRG